MANNKKTGTPMSSIENTNTIKAIKSNCRECYHSEIRKGILYCQLYDRIKPHKAYCKRYSKEDYSISEDEYKVVLKIKENHQKLSFPWERA